MGNRAIVLAGGKASRLGSYTTVLPKPLLPIGDRPVLDIVIRQLKHAEFDRITLAVGYLSHLVRAVIADGSGQGATVDYHDEPEPLGTIGPLTAIDDLEESFLLLNGDVLTTLDYADLLSVHRSSGNILTIASHNRVIRTEYGILHVENPNGNGEAIHRITGFEEKPKLSYTVSMGVYAMEPEVLAYVPDGQSDLPDLVSRLLESDEQVGSYLFDGSWFDLGRQDDYQRATDEFTLLSTASAPTAADVATAVDMIAR